MSAIFVTTYGAARDVDVIWQRVRDAINMWIKPLSQCLRSTVYTLDNSRHRFCTTV